MGNSIIRVENLSKKYMIAHQEQRQYTALRDVIATGARSLATKFNPFTRNSKLSSVAAQNATQNSSREEFWALKDVSFEINQGDRVGIIGRNGAGKSTLLKILSRITEPTSGRIQMRGRVASLLEVGTGFHPELTGRENVFLNGSILGMGKAEIKKKFDEIVTFAEVEKFLDTPVKHYSSGMYVRLAFAVAAYLEPEILIVDEVLAVGDIQFQKKCLGKMENIANSGRTVIFVSHNLLALQDICQRTIWLHRGEIVEEGTSSQVVARYTRTSFSNLTNQIWEDFATAPGNDEVRLHRACVRPIEGATNDPITVCDPFLLEFEYQNFKPDAYIGLNLQLYNEQGILIFETAPVDEPKWLGRPLPAGLWREVCYVPGNLLNNGIHRAVLYLVKDQSVILHKENDILVFEIEDAIENRAGWYGSWDGVVRPILKWTKDFASTRTSND